MLRALTGAGVSDPELADALACDALGVSLDELRAMPEIHLAYRLEIKRQKAKLAELEREAAIRRARSP